MRTHRPHRTWHLGSVVCLLAGGLLVGMYARLPADGASGDLESFTPGGFLVRWVIEPRPGGLQAGDLIVRAGGHTAEEWLAGAAAGEEWRAGGTVIYDVIRRGERQLLKVALAPISPGTLLPRWGVQLVVALAFLGVGLYLAHRRTDDLAARVLMLFCVLVAVQYVGDAYNIQFASLAWGWQFWMHLGFEHTIFGLTLATMTCFALVFPIPHPVISRHPALFVAGLFAAFGAVVAGAMALAPSWTAAVRWGSHASWGIAGAELAIAFAAGLRSARRAADPVSRAQVRWILWCGALGTAILVPGYVLPLIVSGHPPIPHPVVIVVTALIPFTLAVAILRFRLFDIQVVTNRTLVYALVTALLIGLYVLLVRTFTIAAEVLWQGGDRSLVIFAATFVVVVAVEPTRRRVQHLIDRLFFRSKLDYQQLLPDMSQRLATHLAAEQVARLLVSEVVEHLQIAHAELDILTEDGFGFVQVSPGHSPAGTPAVETPSAQHPLARYLGQTDRPLLGYQPPSDEVAEALAYLAARDAALAIPLTVGQKLVGIYYLGLKQSGDSYTSEEVNLLRLLGRQAAVAVENARLFAATERQAKELAGLHKAAVALSSTLAVELTERRRAEDRLKASLAEKEVLLKEVHHRVKNNLQIISSLLYFQARAITDPAVLAMFRESQMRVRSMALVHERLYTTGDLAQVDAAEYVRTLAGYLFRAYGAQDAAGKGSGQICFRIETDDVVLGVDEAVPCGLLLHELVSNALKHAFRGGQSG
ncbi:MAG TPA: histidine kinase dimerization/phosphoacceptor domain -containing protein, partial [Anaerolineae bacterium]|nr:histidine kinase dimerization/phosphoacceptor domain -containing protein [Anaerolineae bacterium]